MRPCSTRAVRFSSVPDEAGTTIGETVVIAWKDAPEAVRAIAAAAPFLEAAKRVRLISIAEDGEEEEDDTASAMTGYLAMAGLPVEMETVPLGGREVGDALLTAAGSGVLPRHGRVWALAVARMDLRRRDTFMSCATRTSPC